MDKIDKTTRSRVMASVRSKNTKPELHVRSAAYKLGFRFRLHRKELPGNPDLVFPSRRVALFVHGCFWHGHDCSRGKRMPATNTDYWCGKIRGNRARDAKALAALRELGWRPVVIWECQAIGSELSQLLVAALARPG